MADARLGLPSTYTNPDPMPDGYRLVATPSSGHEEMTPCSTTSSFNPGSAVGSSLLTPTSGTSPSPSTHSRTLLRHTNTYHPTGMSDHNRTMSPPDEYWANRHSYEMMPTPQSGAPMSSGHGQMHSEDMLRSYSHISQGHPHGNDRRTPPLSATEHPNYLGSFAVSGATVAPQLPNGDMFISMSQVHAGPSALMRDDQNLPVHTQHRDLGRNVSYSQAPLLTQPHPENFRPKRESLSQSPDHSYATASAAAPSPRLRMVQEGKVTKRRPSKRDRAAAAVAASGVGEHINCHGNEVAPDLSADIPEQERLIFESRWRHRHHKGDDMWEHISRDFAQAYPTDAKLNKASLQMKFKRARSRYIQWQSKDIALLRQAYIELEKERYSILLDKFISLGGSQNMWTQPNDIEAKLANDLKLESFLYSEIPPQHVLGQQLFVRSRKPLPSRKETSSKDSAETVFSRFGDAPRTHDPEAVLQQIEQYRTDSAEQEDTEMMGSIAEISRAPMSAHDHGVHNESSVAKQSKAGMRGTGRGAAKGKASAADKRRQ